MYSTYCPFHFALGSALAAVLVAPAAAPAQMLGRQMQSMRSTGMMGRPSAGRPGSMTGGMPNFGRTMYGSGGYPMRTQGMVGSQGVPASSGAGSYGAGTARMTSQPYSSGPNSSYEGASSGSAPTLRTPGYDELAALRGPGGGLSWPVALRYLTRDGVWKEVREQIDARVGVLLAKTREASSPGLISELRVDVNRIRRHFDREGDDLPVSRQQEADACRFLNKVRDALQLLSEPATPTAYR